MELTPDQHAEASRTVLAVARARYAGDDEGVTTLLADLDIPMLQAVIHGLAGMVSELMTSCALAVALIDDDDERQAVIHAGRIATPELAPELRAIVEQSFAAMQARHVYGGQ